MKKYSIYGEIGNNIHIGVGIVNLKSLPGVPDASGEKLPAIMGLVVAGILNIINCGSYPLAAIELETIGKNRIIGNQNSHHIALALAILVLSAACKSYQVVPILMMNHCGKSGVGAAAAGGVEIYRAIVIEGIAVIAIIYIDRKLILLQAGIGGIVFQREVAHNVGLHVAILPTAGFARIN
jgi:hypothetical protein